MHARDDIFDADASRPGPTQANGPRPSDPKQPAQVILGYQTTRLGSTPGEAARKQRELQRLAERQGFHLGQIFDDDDPNRPCAALASLIATARSEKVSVVAVPTVEDLGLLPQVQRLTRCRIEREAHVRVVIARDDL